MKDVVKNDYRVKKYRIEANRSKLNDTPSRVKIVEENDKILCDKKFVEIIKTIIGTKRILILLI